MSFNKKKIYAKKQIFSLKKKGLGLPVYPFYQRLIAKGKKAKVALTACMRKLLVILNAILKKQLFAHTQLSL
jgi:hypothetical protein